MQATPLIRTIYLYLFSLVGLVLVVIASTRFIDMGLRAWIFTAADKQDMMYRMEPTQPYSLDTVKALEKNASISADDKATITRWLADYRTWEQYKSDIDPLAAQRQREASSNLAMLIVGVPLYLYHWRIIKRETKREERSK